MINMVKLPTSKSELFLRVAKGHFATSHSHINYYIDVTTQKTRLSEAKAVAKELVSAYQHSTIVDTVLCLDGTQVIGTCLANELTKDGFANMNAHQTIYVITPEYNLQKTYTVDFLKKKRIKNNGEMPQYYVEDDHEAIIPRALFLQVQEEIARRGSQVDCMGRRRGFSAKHCFTGLLYCAECGEQFRRIHWNNRGCKSVVWRCMTRLEKKGACHARTVYE